MECDNFPALVPKLAQSLDGVRPSGNPDRVNGIRVFYISDCDISRPRGLPVYRIVEPVLRFDITMGM